MTQQNFPLISLTDSQTVTQPVPPNQAPTSPPPPTGSQTHSHHSHTLNHSHNHHHSNIHSHHHSILHQKQREKQKQVGQIDVTKEHLEVFNRFESLIEELGQNFVKKVEIIQSARLEDYKDDLLKTKKEFQIINLNRSDNAINNQVYNKKKTLEKQCNNFLQKSMQVSKIYQNLKAKLIAMQSNYDQLQHEKHYINKKIKCSENKNRQLKQQLKQVEQHFKRKKEKVNKNGQILILGQKLNKINNIDRNQNTQKKRIQENKQMMQNRTKKWNKNIESRLETKAENIRQLLDSLTFQQSTIQKIFSSYDPNQYKEEKKKIMLMEELLSREDIKRQLYELLFGTI